MYFVYNDIPQIQESSFTTYRSLQIVQCSRELLSNVHLKITEMDYLKDIEKLTKKLHRAVKPPTREEALAGRMSVAADSVEAVIAAASDQLIQKLSILWLKSTMQRLWLRLCWELLRMFQKWMLNSRCHVSVHCHVSVQASAVVHATVVDTVVVVATAVHVTAVDTVVVVKVVAMANADNANVVDSTAVPVQVQVIVRVAAQAHRQSHVTLSSRITRLIKGWLYNRPFCAKILNMKPDFSAQVLFFMPVIGVY